MVVWYKEKNYVYGDENTLIIVIITPSNYWENILWMYTIHKFLLNSVVSQDRKNSAAEYFCIFPREVKRLDK